jgi:signal transduction histidine kinase/DNA-binding response OmpR family regulator
MTNDSVRRQIFLWFAVVAILLVLAGVLSYRQISANMSQSAQHRIALTLHHVRQELDTTNALYLDLTRASMRLLKERTTRLGPPRLGPPTTVADRVVPNLMFGSHGVANDFAIMDGIKEIMGGTATLFVNDGAEFVRVTTNVQRDDGSRALATVLDPNGEAIAAIRRNESFYGQVDILGRSYVTGYEPIHDNRGETIGIWYTGYPVETLTGLGEAIAAVRILDNGFIGIFDSRGRRMFASSHVSADVFEQASAAAVASREPVFQLGEWTIEKTHFEPWNYTILAATYRPDIQKLTRDTVANAFAILGLVVLLVLAASYWIAGRLSDALRQASLQKAEAEKARSAAEAANRTKSAFLANMSHELRTPMNAIIGYSEMLIEEADDLGQESFSADLKKIQTAGKHLLGLINDVLDLSKIEAGKMSLYLESFDIKDTIEGVVATVQPLLLVNKNVLKLECADDIGVMRADLIKVRQTLFNLLSNATKFTEQGTVTLAARRRATPRGDRIELVVSDSGIGMTEEQMGRLFQAFSQADSSTTRRYGGTGLGLAICKTFCEMMGGSITVSSVPGTGTSFTVELPAVVDATPAVDDASTTTSPAPVAPAVAGKALVLVIDDDPAVHDLVRRTLAKEGFDVATASNGAEGLEMARRLKPTAITLDVMMPGMDGWTVLSALKADQALADIPVVMMTIVDDREVGFALGASEYVTKPLQLDRLATLIQRFRPDQDAAHVLVVEDEPATREMLERVLRKDGWQVQFARNGRVALDMVAARTPSLIVLDLMMPEMDGFEFLHRLREREGGVDIPVIVLTAKDLTEEDHLRLGGQAQRILEKTAVPRTQLLAEINSLIAHYKPGPSTRNR